MHMNGAAKWCLTILKWLNFIANYYYHEGSYNVRSRSEQHELEVLVSAGAETVWAEYYTLPYRRKYMYFGGSVVSISV